MKMEVSIKESVDELLDTKIFKTIEERNGEKFSIKLAFWLVRYVLMISSMRETLGINFESILIKLHGEDNFKRILELTENMFFKIYEQLNKKC
ncbi:MAG: hypothetical protein JSU91_03840 [Thermoplasmatales archaeon]|nr:MAG: hypothetical protein JSU91_03840 [Thermoplasmatales archaeon]